MNTSPSDLQTAILAYLDGRATEVEISRLSARLRDDAAARTLFLQLADLHSNLAVDEQLWLPAPHPDRATSRKPGEFGWGKQLLRHFLTPLGVGLVLGIICTSVVWARVGAKAVAKPLPLADADFESGSVPSADGVPAVFGKWSGDYSNCVGAEQGITPASGKRMLRFLRPDNEHTPAGAGSFVAELWYLADVHSWAKQASGLPATVELSASFNSVPVASNRRYAFGLSLYAFRGNPELAPALWKEKLDAALAAGDQEELADTNPGSWQRLAARVVVPPDADLLLIQLRVTPKLLKPGEAPDFPGHYVDDVALRLVPDDRR